MFNNMLMGAAGQSIKSTGGFQVNNSAMFDFASAEYLTRTPTTAGNRRTWTWSGWVKRSGLGNPGGPNSSHDLFGVGAGSRLRFTSGDALRLESPSGNHTFITTQLFRDPHAWYHIVLAFDSTQATDTNRRKLYVNGSQVTDFSSTTFTELGQNDEWNINSTSEHQIAKSNLADYFGGYLAEVVLVDGSALGPTSFGETDDNGVWRPISIEDAGLTFGTNGFYLPFTTSAGLGQDYSGSSSETKVQENTYNGGSEVNNGDMSGNPACIAYTAIATAKLATVKLNSSSRGFTNVTVQVQTDNGSNAPDGTTLTNGQVTGITGSGSGLKTVDFPNGGPELTAGTKYWICIPSTDLGSGFEWGIQHDVPGTSGAVGIIDGTGYQAGRGFGHEVFQLGNIWTPVNSPTQTTDTCTDNHCTWSPIISYNKGVSFTEGNMRSTTSTSSGDVGGLIGSYELPTAGKYYWEWVTNTVGTTPSLGWTDILAWNPNATSTGEQTNDAKFITGNDYNTGSGRILSSTIDGSTSLSQAAYGNFLTVRGGNPLQNGTVLGCAYDADNGLAWFSYNNTWVDGNGTDSSSTVKGEIEAGTSGSEAFTTANGAVGEAGLFIFAAVQSVSSGDFTLRTRSEQWTGDCPSGFTALSTKNQAAAVTYAIEDGSAYHQTSTWEGNITARKITQSGGNLPVTAFNSTFQPDWIWGKNRDNGSYSYRYFDSVRGAEKVLQTGGSSYTDAEATDSNGVTDFEADGFDIGNGVHLNGDGESIVAWQWAAGGEPTTDNTAGAGATPTAGSVKIDGSNLGSALGGTIPVTRLSANRKSGFSIGIYTGSGSNGTIATGLTTKPDMLIIKKRGDDGGNNWVTYHSGLANQGTGYMDLGTDAVEGTLANMFNSVAPGASDATLFNVGTNTSTNDSGGTDTYVFYCFHEVPGYSKFGTFKGNGATNGAFIGTGFKPSFILVRPRAAASDWSIFDNGRSLTNVMNASLAPNSTAGDYTHSSAKMDFLSNGIKMRGSFGPINTDNQVHIYMAFAENPFAGTTPITAR